MEAKISENKETTIKQGKKGRPEMGKSHFKIFYVWWVVAGTCRFFGNSYPYLYLF